MSTLIKGLAALGGGAKQTLHYTDLTPAVVVAAITKGGNHPFYRMFQATWQEGTTLHVAALKEILQSFKDDFLSPIYVGWAHGFLDKEREKLESLIPELSVPHGFAPLGHPRTVLLQLAEELGKDGHSEWYA